MFDPRSSNGRTPGSEPGNLGSTPSLGMMKPYLNGQKDPSAKRVGVGSSPTGFLDVFCCRNLYSVLNPVVYFATGY